MLCAWLSLSLSACVWVAGMLRRSSAVLELLCVVPPVSQAVHLSLLVGEEEAVFWAASERCVSRSLPPNACARGCLAPDCPHACIPWIACVRHPPTYVSSHHACSEVATKRSGDGAKGDAGKGAKGGKGGKDAGAKKGGAPPAKGGGESESPCVPAAGLPHEEPD